MLALLCRQAPTVRGERGTRRVSGLQCVSRSHARTTVDLLLLLYHSPITAAVITVDRRESGFAPSACPAILPVLTATAKIKCWCCELVFHASSSVLLSTVCEPEGTL